MRVEAMKRREGGALGALEQDVLVAAIGLAQDFGGRLMYAASSGMSRARRTGGSAR